MRFLLLFAILFMGCLSAKQQQMEDKKKIIIAHRGASGYLPEHTLPAKAMAYAMQPDYLEQDVVLSKEGTPIVIHDIHLDAITNVATVFPDRKREDNRYYVIDFTFKELKQLLVTERFNYKTGNQVFKHRFPKNKSRFGLHSLQEEIELIQGLNRSTTQNIGICPEIKDPSFHRKEGKDISKIVLRILAEYGYQTKDDKCIVQCFDSNELKRIRTEFSSELFLVKLMEYEDEIDRIPNYANYADGIGPWIVLLKNKKCIELAKKHNLKVYGYTLRADQIGEAESFEALLEKVLYKVNIDGVFTDHPDKVKYFLNK